MPAANGPDPLESYQLLTFTVETEDSFVSESPLFRRGLLYDWNILLQKRQGIIRTRLDTWRKKSQPPIFLGAKSNSPTVLRSAPWSGTLTVSVTLKQKDKKPYTCSIEERAPTLDDSYKAV